MSWRELISREIETTYATTDKLLNLVRDDELDFKPATGSNWLTIGQLLLHISNACGSNIKGFITGDWGMPEGVNLEDLSPEEMLKSDNRRSSRSMSYSTEPTRPVSVLACCPRHGSTALRGIPERSRHPHRLEMPQ